MSHWTIISRGNYTINYLWYLSTIAICRPTAQDEQQKLPITVTSSNLGCYHQHCLPYSLFFPLLLKFHSRWTVDSVPHWKGPSTYSEGAGLVEVVAMECPFSTVALIHRHPLFSCSVLNMRWFPCSMFLLTTLVFVPGCPLALIGGGPITSPS